MADYIDRQAAIEAIRRAEALCRAFGYHNAIDALRSVPSADAVPVVRCKDCKHKIINENVPRKPIICCRTLMVGETVPDWFCADGER